MGQGCKYKRRIHFLRGFYSSGKKFMRTIPDINFVNGDYVEAKIDMTTISDTLNQAKHNIFSVGNEIDRWSTSEDHDYNIHLYYPHKDPGDHLLRFSAVIGEKVNNTTMRTMGIIKIPGDIITIRISSQGIVIDGVSIEHFENNNLNSLKASGEAGNYKYVTEDDRPADTYHYLLTNYLMADELHNLQVGSMEGKTRSWAHYYYIKYHINLN